MAGNMGRYKRRWNPKTRRWVYQHREVMESVLGRALTSNEHVHHKDGNWLNNDLSNLELMTRSQHMQVHRIWAQKPVVVCVKCGKVQHAKGLCKQHYTAQVRAIRGRVW